MARAPGRSAGALVGLVLLAAVAYLLGWLKTLYYFRTFGVGLATLDLHAADLMLESWFVLHNVLFFVLLWWIVLRTRRAWVILVAVVHGLLPLAAHYAFALYEWAPARWLIHYRHTLLKLLPFAVLIVVWLLYPRQRSELGRAWPHGIGGLLVWGLVTLAWAVSAAKHFGSFDAQLALAQPDLHLTRVQVTLASDAAPSGAFAEDARLYLVHADERTLVLWDQRGFTYGESTPLRVWVVPRADVRCFELQTGLQLQPGAQFF